jgi:hypothetical protein
MQAPFQQSSLGGTALVRVIRKLDKSVFEVELASLLIFRFNNNRHGSHTLAALKTAE